MKKELTKEQVRKDLSNEIKELSKIYKSIEKQIDDLEKEKDIIENKKDFIASQFSKFAQFKVGDMFIKKPSSNFIISKVESSYTYKNEVVIIYSLKSVGSSNQNQRYSESELIDVTKKGQMIQVTKRKTRGDKNPKILMVTSIRGYRKEYYDLEGIKRKRGESREHGWRYLFETKDEKGKVHFINVLFKSTPSYLDPDPDNYYYEHSLIDNYKMQFKKKVLFDGRVTYDFYVKRYTSRFELFSNEHTYYQGHSSYDVEIVPEKDVFETLIEFS